MGRSTLWSFGFLFGVSVILVTAVTLSPLAGLAVILGSLTFIAWRGRWAGLAGLLTGFGGFWLLLVLLEFWSGDELDDSAIFWFFIAGIVPLAAGWALRFKIGQEVPAAEAPSEPTPSETTFPEPASAVPASPETASSESASAESMPSSEPVSVEMMPSETTFPEIVSPEQSPPGR